MDTSQWIPYFLKDKKKKLEFNATMDKHVLKIFPAVH